MNRTYEYRTEGSNNGRPSDTAATSTNTSTAQESFKSPKKTSSDYCIHAIQKDRSWYAVATLNEPEKKQEKSNEKKKRGSINTKRATVCSNVEDEELAFKEKKKKTVRQTKEKKTPSKVDRKTNKTVAPKKNKSKDETISFETVSDDKGSKEKTTQRCSVQKPTSKEAKQ